MSGKDYKHWRNRQRQIVNHGRHRQIQKTFRETLRRCALWRYAAPIAASSLASIAEQWGEIEVGEERLRPSRKWTESSAIFCIDVELALKRALAYHPELHREWREMIAEEVEGRKPLSLTLAKTKLRSELAEKAGKEFQRRQIGTRQYWNGGLSNGKR